jgi:hypothetical protein
MGEPLAMHVAREFDSLAATIPADCPNVSTLRHGAEVVESRREHRRVRQMNGRGIRPRRIGTSVVFARIVRRRNIRPKSEGVDAHVVAAVIVSTIVLLLLLLLLLLVSMMLVMASAMATLTGKLSRHVTAVITPVVTAAIVAAVRIRRTVVIRNGRRSSGT